MLLKTFASYSKHQPAPVPQVSSEENSFEELKLAPEVISETQEVQEGDKVGYMDDYPLDPLTAHE